jgi:4-amino-4-deoxy-L-arabinose transferase-like glycosyltransferase
MAADLNPDSTANIPTSPQASASWPYMTLLLWTLPLVLMQSAGQSLMSHDEGIYAMQARTIVETNDWITPQWGGQISFDRTIGIQWLIALSYRLFGISELAVRLPSMVAFVGSVLLLYRIVWLITSRRSLSWLSAAIFAVMPIAVQYARLGTQDSLLVAIELLAAWALLESEVQQRRSLLLLTGAAFGWAFMVKGFMAIPAAIAFLPYLLLQFRPHKHLLNPWLYVGLIIGVIPVAGWLWAAMQQYGMMPLQELVFKLFYLKENTNYSAGPFYYLWNIPANGFPWVFFAIAGIVLSLRNLHCYQLIKQHWALALGFPLTLFLELMLFKTRTHYYPLQLLPWLALFAGIAVDRLLYLYRQQRGDGAVKVVSWVLGLLGLGLVGLGGLGFVDRLPLLPGIERGEVLRVSGLAVTLGVGWMMLLGTWLTRQQQWIFRSARQWLMALILPVWLGLGILGLTGLWGDYSPALKAMMQEPTVREALQVQPVDFLVSPPELGRGDRKRHLLLSYYTPQHGQYYRQWEPVDLAWVDPNLAAVKPEGYETLAEFFGWELVRREATHQSPAVSN